jgi:glycosyltransferase involved in cell wall biosynthesis
LLHSAPAVLASYPDARFVIVGDGPERPRLQKLVDELGLTERAVLAGLVPWTDVPAYLSMASIFVAPSIRDHEGNLDGLPTVVLEAMAASRPVIATSVGGLPLVVEHEKTGLIVPDSDPLSLANALVRLLGSSAECQHMGHESRLRVERDLNWHMVARRFDDLYLADQA